MLLKNLNIEVKAHGVFIGVNVIIKRGEKHYSVYNNYFSPTEKIKDQHIEPSWIFINKTIHDFLLHCENIDKKWHTSEMPPITIKGILEYEIDYNDLH